MRTLNDILFALRDCFYFDFLLDLFQIDVDESDLRIADCVKDPHCAKTPQFSISSLPIGGLSAAGDLAEFMSYDEVIS
jgi:hypothetical protein